MVFTESERPVSMQAGNGLQERIGGVEEDRTPDLRIANAALSQLSYDPTQRSQSTPE